MSAPYPVDFYPGCPCYACDSPTWTWAVEPNPTTGAPGLPNVRMSLCPTCGSKRCPGAADHRQHDAATLFVCPRCGMASYNAIDAAEGYCGACHEWTRQ